MQAKLELPHGSQLPLEAGDFAFGVEAGDNFPDSTQNPSASILIKYLLHVSQK